MSTDDELPEESTERGSDELLSHDDLRLPESASMLVRLHAVRAWLLRRQNETTIEIGEAALSLQYIQQDESQDIRLRRSEREMRSRNLQEVQELFQEAQQRLSAYEEAQALLEECVAHTTSSERVLVEYYLTLEELLQAPHKDPAEEETTHPSPRLVALTEVLHRVEHVGDTDAS